MAYKNERIKQGPTVELSCSSQVFKSVRSSNIQRSMKRRTCWCCGETIDCNAPYVSHAFRYDNKILTVAFHEECYTK